MFMYETYEKICLPMQNSSQTLLFLQCTSSTWKVTRASIRSMIFLLSGSVATSSTSLTSCLEKTSELSTSIQFEIPRSALFSRLIAMEVDIYFHFCKIYNHLCCKRNMYVHISPFVVVIFSPDYSRPKNFTKSL